jgi:uncharacterized protein YndB with AHSA1/START domain
MTKRTVTHSTFTIERAFDVPPPQVFQAFADPAAKARWFAGPDDWSRGPHVLDFRVGGRERASGGPKGGLVHTFDALYQDIIPNERIVYSYDMHLDATRISVSLTTVELEPLESGGTRLLFTEQGAYLDGRDTPAQREEGTRGLLDALGAALEHADATSGAGGRAGR